MEALALYERLVPLTMLPVTMLGLFFEGTIGSQCWDSNPGFKAIFSETF